MTGPALTLCAAGHSTSRTMLRLGVWRYITSFWHVVDILGTLAAVVWALTWLYIITYNIFTPYMSLPEDLNEFLAFSQMYTGYIYLRVAIILLVGVRLYRFIRYHFGRVSAYALLAQGYTPITFLGTSDSSTLAAGALLPKAVYRWTVSADLLRDELRHLHRVFVSPHINEVKGNHLVEESCRDAYRDRVLIAVNRVLEAEGREVEYRKPGFKIPAGGEPDFGAYATTGTPDGTRTFVVGEAKTPKALEGVTDDLIGTQQSQHVGNLRDTICQAWGYVMGSDADPEAGFFGTTNRVWFFRADRANQAMYVTDAVHCHATSPSVRQMMYLLLCLKDKPLPTDAIPWEQRDYNRILVELAGQDSQQGQQACGGQQQGHQACRGQQQGGTGQQGGRQGPVTRLQAKARAASDQQAVAALTSHNIIPFEEFQDRVPIGGGETGTVFAARLHGCRVAVKTGDCYNRKDVVRRMMDEAATYKALQHLQGYVIPRLEEHGYTMWGGSYFVATQLITGRTHKEGREVPLAQRRAAEQALAAIHASGFLHGDVRGDNLIFEEGTGKVFFVDLGFSKACSCGADFEAELCELRGLLLP